LLPDFTQAGAGLFLIERWRKPQVPWSFEGGLRFDYQNLRADGQSPRDFGNWTGQLGLAYQPDERLHLRLNAASAFRPPHPSELYSDGLHHGSASYEIGNPGLNAERARQLSLGGEWQPAPNWQVTANAYAQWIADFIYVVPQPDPVLTIRGAFPAFAYQSTDARLLGGDAQLSWTPTPDWTWSAGYQIVRGHDQVRDEPLFYMPADQWRTNLRYRFGRDEPADRPFLQVGLRRTAEQTRVPAARDFAPAPPGYTLVDLEAGGTYYWGKQALQLSLGVRNVFDVAFRDYLDRFRYFADSPGRNVLLSLRLPFGNQ
jgi:iron complex outermembrane receptor protein